MADTIDMPVMTRREARTAGLEFYFTGKPCPQGHLALRRTVKPDCMVCAAQWRAAAKKKPSRNPVKRLATERGEKTYQDGKPCPNGHENPKRRTSNSTCVICVAAKVTKHRRRRIATDPEGWRAERKRWAETAKPKTRVYQAVYQSIRKAKVKGAQGSYTREDVARLRIAQDGKCAACGQQKRLEVDHIKAIADGGSNNPVNLQLLCRNCNASKGALDFREWLVNRESSPWCS